MTWVGVATAVLRVGATPVFCACKPDSFIGDVDAFGPEEFSVILAVHTYASRLEIDRITERFSGIPLIEDFSHCHGARLNDGKAGSKGIISICSLQASKLLTCGEGGCALTDDPTIAAKLAALSADSRIWDYSTGSLIPANTLHGANHAMSEMQAAIALAHLTSLDEELAIRAKRLRRFVDRLATSRVLYACDPAVLADGAFYGLPIAIPGWSAEKLREYLSTQLGLGCDFVYPAIPCSPLYRPATIPLYSAAASATSIADFAGDDELQRRWVLIPHWAFLASEEHIDCLANGLISGADERSIQQVPRSRPRRRVAVVILTRDRPELLEGAIASVGDQDSTLDRAVFVVNNGFEVDLDRLRHRCPRTPIYSYTVRGASFDELPSVRRVAHLRNFALSLVDSDFVCFLDDDNQWEVDHLSSLYEVLIDHAAAASHSWRTVVCANGDPLPLHEFPWARTRTERLNRFEDATRAGLLSPGSAVVRDSVSALVDGRDVGMVDMGCWLFPRDLITALGLETSYDGKELDTCVGEDDKMLRALRLNAVPVACSMRPTLRYRLGGFSNVGAWIQ